MNTASAATATAGVAVSLVVSVVLWQVFDLPLFFLAVPFVPFLLRSRDDDQSDRNGQSTRDAESIKQSARTCPRCSFATRNSEYEFCPRDGAELQRR